jgi:fatty-acyl-CoA synthase
MQALMQQWSLTLDKLLEHAARWHGDREIVTRSVEGPITRTTYSEVHARARRVSNALKSVGIGAGDRVATLAWNSARHLEVCYGVIGIGAVYHTLNPRLFPEQLVYIVNHAEDRVIFADPGCTAQLEAILPKCPTVQSVIFMCEAAFKPATSFASIAYEDWIEGQPTTCEWGKFDENSAAGLCYTSGTTGHPKGVLYGHRSNYLHAMMTLQPDALALSARDSVLLVVPMYHANAWGVVYSAPMVGAKLVLPGQKMDGASIHELLETEGVTYSAAVPTVWQMLLEHLRATRGKLSTLRRVTIGGSACPESIIRAFHEDYGVDVIHGWGMTETSPLGTVAHPPASVAALSFEEQLPFKLKQGRLLCNLDLKLVDDSGSRLPNDGATFGRLMIKGPTVARRYFRSDRDALDDEGYFDTGDVAKLDASGVMQIVDRAKDVIKSGGEWISSIDVENIVVGHPKVALAAVIGVAHPKWDERPILLVQLKTGEQAVAREFLSFLEGKIARWWMPDEVLIVDAIPLGPTGKIDKKAIRARLADYVLPTATESASRS